MSCIAGLHQELAEVLVQWTAEGKGGGGGHDCGTLIRECVYLQAFRLSLASKATCSDNEVSKLVDSNQVTLLILGCG